MDTSDLTILISLLPETTVNPFNILDFFSGLSYEEGVLGQAKRAELERGLMEKPRVYPRKKKGMLVTLQGHPAL